MANRITHTSQTFVDAARAVHGSKFDYSQIDFVSVNRLITVICPAHGPFNITAKHLLNPSTCCPQCRKRGAIILKEDFVAESQARYGDNFLYTHLPDTFLKTDKLTFICKTHGEYEQPAYLHLAAKKHSCRACMLAMHGTANRKRSTKVGKPLRQGTCLSEEDLQWAKRLTLKMWNPPR